MMAEGMAVGGLVLTVGLLFLAGYITQRSSVCAVAAAREVALRGSANRLIGFLLSAAIATLIMAIDALAGRRVFNQFTGHIVTVPSLVGAVLFAVGAWANGRCAMGTLADLAAGDLARIGTIVGMIGGIFGGTLLFGWWLGGSMTPTVIVSPYQTLPAELVLAMAGCCAVVLALILRRSLKQASKPRFWSPLLAMVLIGAASGALFALDRNWPYTTLLTDIARGTFDDVGARVGFAFIVLTGSSIAARQGGAFAVRRGSAGQWGKGLAAGIVMGLGASLVPGGNEAMLYTGLPLLLPNLAAAYAVTMASLILFAWLSNRHAAQD